MESLKFSLIVRCYNSNFEWLKRALDSVGGLFDEIVIVDDGSVIPIYQCIYDGAKLVRHEKNLGTCEARNSGVKNATGDIICWLDDDDYFDSKNVLELKKVVEENPSYSVYYFRLQEFGLSNKIYDGGGDPVELEYRNSIPGISWHSKKLWSDLGGYKHVRAEDWAFWLEAYRRGYTFKYIHIIGYNMNVRDGSHSRSYNVSFNEIRDEVLDAYKEVK